MTTTTTSNDTVSVADTLLVLTVATPYFALRASLWAFDRTTRLADWATDRKYGLWERLPWWAKVRTQEERDANWQRFLDSMRSKS